MAGDLPSVTSVSRTGGAGGAKKPGTGGGSGSGGTPIAPAPTGDASPIVEAGDARAVPDGAAPSDAVVGDVAAEVAVEVGGAEVAPAGTPLPAPCPASADLSVCLSFDSGLVDESVNRLQLRVDGVTLVPGVSGQGAAFTRGSQLRVTRTPLLDAERITVEAWVKPDSLTRRMTVLENPGQYGIHILPSGSAMCSGSGGYALSNDEVVAGRFTHLLCTFEPGNISLYVDGRLRRQGPIARVTMNEAMGLRVGWNNMGEDFVGVIDEVRLWRTVRPPVAP